jgi:thioesterase domain-containing protein/acyl carrier protein
VKTETALYELLTNYLAGVLRVSKAEIDPAKSFDEYGLDSIDAVIATESIGRQLEIELPPEFLFINNNLNAVVRALLGGYSTHNQPPSQRDTQPPIFFFPGAGGRDEPALVRFRSQCPESVHFDIVSIGDWREWIKHDFEVIVDRICQHIKAVASDGPIWLVGYSQGGQAAFATAVALERLGHSVRFVGLIDSSMHGRPSYTSEITSVFNVLKWLELLRPYASASIRGRSYNSPPGYLRARAINWIWQLKGGTAQRRKRLSLIARCGGLLFCGRGGVMLDAWIGMRLFNEMWADWVIQKGDSLLLHAPVVLFRSEVPGTQDLGWAPLCPNFQVALVRGDHHTMFKGEHLETLIAQLVAVLAQQGFSEVDQSKELQVIQRSGHRQ